MEVSELSPIISHPDTDNHQIQFLIHPGYYERYEHIRNALGPVLAGIDISLEHDLLMDMADNIMSIASVTVGLLRIELMLGALALYELLNRISITAYEIIEYPARLGQARLGESRLGGGGYEIAPKD